jgi:hypothetical protein
MTDQETEQERIIGWHRLFGLTLRDLFTHTPYTVELEKDLTLQQQFLDVVIIEQNTQQPFDPNTLPDGLDNLKTHNLLTYKSFRESLDSFSLDELIGHTVNYQKQFAPNLPREHLQLYAVTTRHPRQLFTDYPPKKHPKSGLYDLPWGSHKVRIIVLKNIAPHPRNAAWNLFSAQLDKIKQGANDYTWQQQITVMQQLFRYYNLEEFIPMAYTYEQFEREFKQEIKHEIFDEFKEEFLQQFKEEFLQQCTLEERLQGLKAEERLQGLKAEEILATLNATTQLRLLRAEDRLQVMFKMNNDLETLRVKIQEDELLQTLSADELALLLNRLVKAGQLSQVMADALQGKD